MSVDLVKRLGVEGFAPYVQPAQNNVAGRLVAFIQTRDIRDVNIWLEHPEKADITTEDRQIVFRGFSRLRGIAAERFDGTDQEALVNGERCNAAIKHLRMRSGGRVPYVTAELVTGQSNTRRNVAAELVGSAVMARRADGGVMFEPVVQLPDDGEYGLFPAGTIIKSTYLTVPGGTCTIDSLRPEGGLDDTLSTGLWFDGERYGPLRYDDDGSSELIEFGRA